MYNPSLKPILIGIGVGIVLFALPFFLLKAALFFLIFGAIFRIARRLYWGSHPRMMYSDRGYGHRSPTLYGTELHPAFADSIRNMSEEEYDTFRQKLAAEQPIHTDSRHKTTIEIQ